MTFQVNARSGNSQYTISLQCQPSKIMNTLQELHSIHKMIAYASTPTDYRPAQMPKDESSSEDTETEYSEYVKTSLAILGQGEVHMSIVSSPSIVRFFLEKIAKTRDSLVFSRLTHILMILLKVNTLLSSPPCFVRTKPTFRMRLTRSSSSPISKKKWISFLPSSITYVDKREGCKRILEMK